MSAVEIRHRVTGTILFSYDGPSVLAALRAAITTNANLSCANLSCANLSGANLRDVNLRDVDLSYANLGGANLSCANLSCANLSCANLSGADLLDVDLSGANLRDVDLSGANLSYANLSGANLRDVNLRGADLGCANLRGANLSGVDLSCVDLSGADLSCADLSGANLRGARDDLYEVLSHARAEAPGLLVALRAGKVDGQVYQADCACLVGTLANVRGCDYWKLAGIEPNSRRSAERWFLAIGIGDTPETSQVVAITVGWIEAWLAGE